MKIIFANNYFFVRGGSERVFFDEIKLLQSKGHVVATFSARHGSNLEGSYNYYFPNSPNYEERNVLKKAPALIKFIYSFEAKDKLLKLINIFKPDLIHLHNIYGRLTTSIIDAARKINIPVVMTAHDYKLICPTYLMLNKYKPCEKCIGGQYIHCLIERCHKNEFVGSLTYTIESYFNYIMKKYKHINYIICPSRFLLSRLIAAGWQEDKLAYIPNPIDVTDINPNFEVGKYILFFGRLSLEKGVSLLIDVARTIPLEIKIVGEGPLKQELISYAIKNKIKNVEFLNYKTGRDLFEVIKSAAFVVLPSLWYENAPLSIIESFACGKPVVASNIGGIPEMVINGETGLLAKAGDGQDLESKIMYLINNTYKIQEMGKRARKMAERIYSLENHFKLLINLYESAVK